jgi:hypothetical protein
MWPDAAYLVQDDEKVKSARPVALIAEALCRPQIAGDPSTDILL